MTTANPIPPSSLSKELSKGIVSIHHMICNRNDIKTCLAEKVYRSSETHGPIGISAMNVEIAKQHDYRPWPKKL